MCGLIGVYSSNMLAKHRNALANLLYLDTWRGRDSTGVAAIRSNADTHILKSTVPGYEFIEGPKLDQHLKLSDFCWIGHNRHGTIGRNIKSNAHPFEILDEDGSCILVGAHNGTLKNKHDLTDHAQFGTDSEALYNEIAFSNLKESIGKVEGAWALTYYDHVTEELRFLRNKERTLFFCFEEGNKTLLWASEMWMLRVVCSRNDIKLAEDKVFSFDEDTLYKFPVPLKINDELIFEVEGGYAGKAPAFFQASKGQTGTGGKTGQEKPLTETAQTTQKPLLTGPGSTTQSGTLTLNSGGKPESTNGKSSNSQSSNKWGSVVSIDKAKTFKGFQGVALSRREIEDQLAGGCGWCENEFIDLDERFAWLAPNKPVCNKCLTGAHKPTVVPFKTSSVH